MRDGKREVGGIEEGYFIFEMGSFTSEEGEERAGQ